VGLLADGGGAAGGAAGGAFCWWWCWPTLQVGLFEGAVVLQLGLSDAFLCCFRKRMLSLFADVNTPYDTTHTSCVQP